MLLAVGTNVGTEAQTLQEQLNFTESTEALRLKISSSSL